MSTISPHKSLERLNYFNGQRLTAADFTLEQKYHIDVRRQLNRVLFPPGIADGLEVEVNKTDPKFLTVSKGVALDVNGQEIILLQDRDDVPISGRANPEGMLAGNYVLIAFNESKADQSLNGCAVTVPGAVTASEDQTWGGYGRWRTEPIISIEDQLPAEEGAKILLAQLELDEKCHVKKIHTFLRRNIGVTRNRTLEIVGDGIVAADSPKKIHFNIRGGSKPGKAELQLRAEPFPVVLYREVGEHDHPLTLTVEKDGNAPKHFHELKEIETEEAGEHTHDVKANTLKGSGTVDDALQLGDHDTENSDLKAQVDFEVSAGTHKHTIGPTGATPLPKTQGASAGLQKYKIPETTTGVAGAKNEKIRGNDPLKFIDSLEVLYDGSDITTKITERLKIADPRWSTLGDGKDDHPLVTSGTGVIDLADFAMGMVDLSPGPHSITLQVSGANTGGQIHYILYLET